MSFRIIRDDITRVRADAIVNTANPEPVFGDGLDRAVYEAAGEERLLEARKRIGSIRPGKAAVTDAFSLPSRFIIHTAGPLWIDGNHGEYEILASCYRESLRLAENLGCGSIAFPLISAGVYGFPKAEALRIALDEISSFLSEPEIDTEVILVVFNKDAFEISSSLHGKVDQFIDDKYAHRKHREEHPLQKGDRRRVSQIKRRDFVSGSVPEDTSSFREFFMDSVSDPSSFSLSEPDYSDSLQDKENDLPSYSQPFAARQDSSGDGKNDLPLYTVSEKPERHAFRKEKPNVLRETLDLLKEKNPFRKISQEELEEAVRNPGESFQQMLLRLIDERQMTDPQVYKKANIDRKLFSKIRCTPNYKPHKKTALALAIALELDLQETVDLLGRAELALSPASRSDLIIEYCIENGIYNIIEINALLFEYEQPLLC